MTAALEGKAGPGATPGMPTPPWGKRDRAGLSGPQTAPSQGVCPSRSLQMLWGASQPHQLRLLHVTDALQPFFPYRGFVSRGSAVPGPAPPSSTEVEETTSGDPGRGFVLYKAKAVNTPTTRTQVPGSWK